jgi:glutathione peroxidase-family protein
MRVGWVAGACGWAGGCARALTRPRSYTKSNYEQLVAMDEKYKGELAILAFPSNQFRGQEPGTPSEIREFVRKRNVTFDMMEKSDVNGPNTNPIYKALKAATDSADQDIAWNFETKFLIARDGVSVTRLSKAFNNDKIRDNIEALIVAGRGSDAKM